MALIKEGRARISAKIRTSSISIDLTGASMDERTAMFIYKLMLNGTSTPEEVAEILQYVNEKYPG